MVKINNILFANEEFHNGEVIYKGATLHQSHNIIQISFEDNRDITNILIATKYIRDKVPEGKLTLQMKYIPYSRMDREIPEGNQLFSMKYVAEIINDQKYDEVVVLDPHSPVSENLLNNIKDIDLWKYVEQVINQYQPDYFFYPDKGANTKYTKLFEDKTELPHFYGTKKRDLTNKGKLIQDSYELHDTPDLNGKKVLIIDDLVSMGGTALLAARALKEANACEVALWVAHCENGIFVGKVFKRIPFSKKDKSDIFAGQYLIDKVYTARTTPLNNIHENLIYIEE